jgi:hypothetical protein
MPPNAWSPKRERRYEHIKESLEDRGTNEDKAEEIAATRGQAGEPTTSSATKPASAPSKAARACEKPSWRKS